MISSENIVQLDGNVSEISFSESSSCYDLPESPRLSQSIPVFYGFRPEKCFDSDRVTTRKVIRRNNKVLQAASLPKVSSYNMRSLMPKVHSLAMDIKARMCNLTILCEVWERQESKKHQFKLEELLEMHGIDYISTPRNLKRGGGAAILVDLEHFTLSKLNINIPKNLEIVWGLIKPKVICGKITKIICCSFYCPPKSKKKSALIEHMAMTLQSLRTIHPKAGVIISGDRNDLCIQKLLNIDASLKQTVLHPTRGTKILTVILTDLQDFYNDPIIVPPVSVDNPQTGVPSDHMGVVYIPINTVDEVANKQKVTRTIRPITDAGIRNIGQVFTHEKWEFLDPSLSPSTLTSLFTSYTKDIINNFCPEKIIVERPGSNPFMTEDMKVLKRKTMREYEKRGKSSKYLDLRTNLDQKIKKEKLKYKDKVLDQVFNGTRSSSYAAIRRLGERPGDACAGSSFILPEHADLNLGSEQAVELIANHFAAISKEFSPIDLNNFSPKLRKALAAPDWSIVPKLTEYQVYKRICKAKKPNSSVPDDLPKKIVQEFAVELQLQ